jgi:hypothetical protein
MSHLRHAEPIASLQPSLTLEQHVFHTTVAPCVASFAANLQARHAGNSSSQQLQLLSHHAGTSGRLQRRGQQPTKAVIIGWGTVNVQPC